MRCLCCGKPFTDKSSESERLQGWHNICIRKFFSTAIIPELDLTEEELKRIAEQSVNDGFTVTGVQKKLSLHLTNDGKPRLTIVNFPNGYILKPQASEYEFLPESEHCIMEMAKATRIKTVPFALLRLNPSFAYITKRIDRIINNGKAPEIKMLAMEDFCQLDGKLTIDKYHGSYERCAKIIERYSSQSELDKAELFLRLVFCFVTGNSDMHLKNFSLIESTYKSGEYVLSPAYDMLPVNLILPEDKEEFALTMNDKKNRISRKDFLAFANNIRLNINAAEKMLSKVISMKRTYIDLCEDSFMPKEMQRALINLIEERTERLK